MTPERKLDLQTISSKTLDVSGVIAVRALRVVSVVTLLTLIFGPFPNASFQKDDPSEQMFEWSFIECINKPPTLLESINQSDFYLCQSKSALLRSIEGLPGIKIKRGDPVDLGDLK